MSYLVLARKYRPDTFAQVVGQEAIARTLGNALRSGRFAHAYLFTGPRGVGKTSMARILAKALQCERGPTPEPCGTCSRCRAVVAGNDLDVIEIDGASNRGIESIRDLRESVRYAASAGGYKVYIVDEVHQITTDAFNAFLKTLEEPPAHVVFVFATTEVAKVPETIRSRCQEFEFRRIPVAAIAATVESICSQEEIELEAGVAQDIAHRARGGLRDALSLLDQLAAYGDGKVTAVAYRELTGFVADAKVREFLDLVLAGDAPAVLGWVKEALDHGCSAGDLLDQWLDYARALLHRCAGNREAPPVPGVAEEHLLAQIEGLDQGHVLAWMQVFLEARQRLRQLEDERLLLDMVALELLRVGELPTLSRALQELAGGGPGLAATPASAARPSPTRAPPAKAVVKSQPPSPTGRPASGSSPGSGTGRGTKTAAAAARALDPVAVLEALREALRGEAPSLLASLQHVEAVEIKEGELRVRLTDARSGSLPDARLDALARRITRSRFGAALTIREHGATPPATTRRPAQLDQIQDTFGGETVSG